ncbi:MAG TPA: hypothetical protein VM510_04270 [Caulifigura sp.]|jgi:hypothetical protein|nr:hypothetical protein [Caulifigura sp.]
MKRVSWMSGVALCLAVIAGSTAMARTIRSTVDVTFPGVDVDGNLDDSLGADGVVKATFNDRTGRLRLVGRAVVTNESNRTQVYADAGLIDSIGIDGDVVRDRYRVTARGRAVYSGLVQNSTGIVL